MEVSRRGPGPTGSGGGAIYVGDYWDKHFDVRLGEQLERKAGRAQ